MRPAEESSSTGGVGRVPRGLTPRGKPVTTVTKTINTTEKIRGFNGQKPTLKAELKTSIPRWPCRGFGNVAPLKTRYWRCDGGFNGSWWSDRPPRTHAVCSGVNSSRPTRWEGRRELNSRAGRGADPKQGSLGACPRGTSLMPLACAFVASCTHRRPSQRRR